MKQNILLYLIRYSMVLLLICIAYLLHTQTVSTAPENPFHPGTTSGEVFTWYTALYTALVTVLTYVQGWLFPNAGAAPQTVLRWVIIAVITAGIFIALGLANGFQVFMGFIASALAYDKVLKPLGFSTPKGK